MTDSGASYVGQSNLTLSGRPCQAWASQWPHMHPYDDVSYFPDSIAFEGATMASLENYCRNPNLGSVSNSAPWCYLNVSDSIVEMEYCPIPRCKGNCTSFVPRLLLQEAQTAAGKSKRLYKWSCCIAGVLHRLLPLFTT